MSDTALTVYQRHFNFILLTGLFCQLLAQIDGAPISDAVQLGTSGDVKDRADHLFKTWGAMYGLDKNQTLPPRQLYRPEVLPAADDTPLAPHMEDCWLDREGGGWDGMGENGQPLWWEGGAEGDPAPPWIRGCDDDNLPMTRRAQADIWRHQHPAMCRNASLKFVVAKWLSGSMYGLGSQLHVITTLFSEAVANDRIFVFEPGSFVRSRHAHCKALGQWGSLGCYFAPFTAPRCEREALQLLAESRLSNASRDMSAQDLLKSDLRVVQVKFVKAKFKDAAGGGSRWGTPWLQAPISSERLGVVEEARNVPDLWKKKLWWRSQVLRYMLRRPTPYLCHLTNSHRHVAFGEQVANQLARSEIGMRRAARLSQALSANKVDQGWREYEALQKADLDVLNLYDEMEKGDSVEPYMPRPIVSLHVRQGDKAGEMKLVSFASHMWLAERIRFHKPQTKNVWLSTEMQSVVEQSKGYKDWRFFYTKNLRQFGTTKMYEYENAVGLEKLVGISFVNLLISAQCDYFVGPLGSNWNRIINELRLTNGRLKSGYLTFAGWM